MASKTKTVPRERIKCLAFSADGKRLLIGKDNGLIATVDAQHGRLLDSFKAHDTEIRAILVRPRENTYITVPRGGELREWGASGRRPVDFQAAGTTSWTKAAISPDGKRVALTGWPEDSLSIYAADSGQRTHRLATGKAPDSVAFSRDGNLVLCVAGEDARIELWDLAQGKRLWSRTDDRVAPRFGVDANFLSACAFGPGEGEYMTAINSAWVESTFCICDLETGAIRKEFSAFSGSATFAISPDGTLLATDGYPPAVEIWDVKTGKRIRSGAGHQLAIRCLAFSPDGRFVASGSDDGSVIVWASGTRASR